LGTVMPGFLLGIIPFVIAVFTGIGDWTGCFLQESVVGGSHFFG
jgi:hypothetical protein